MSDTIIWMGWLIAISIGVIVGSFMPPWWASATAGILGCCACWRIIIIRESWQAEMDREAAKYARRARNAGLGALVNEETAKLLEQLASYANLYDAPESAYDARALAARIREALEALEMNDEN